MKACFLDSCAAIDILAGRKPVRLAVEGYDDALMSHIVLGELFVGCRRSQSPERGIAQLRAWLPTVSIIMPTPHTSEIYGVIEAELRKQGTPIPHNDVWIAALCIECGLPLVSTDVHFDRIAELQRIGY